MRKSRSIAILGATASLALAAFGLGPASASAAPEWEIEVVTADRIIPGQTFHYWLLAKNVGDEATDGNVSLDVTLPPGVTGKSVKVPSGLFPSPWVCSDPSGASSLHCEVDASTYPIPFLIMTQPGKYVGNGFLGAGGVGGAAIELEAELDPGASGEQFTELQLSGGGAIPDSTAHPINVSATADFGIKQWDGHIAADEEGKLQAGAHPEDIVTTLNLKSYEREGLSREAKGIINIQPEAAPRDIVADLPAGFVGSPSAAPTCDPRDLVPVVANETGVSTRPDCPINSIVGTITVRTPGGLIGSGATEPGGILLVTSPIFNMRPPGGDPARFGFNIAGYALELSANARTDGDLGVVLRSLNTNQGLTVLGAVTTFWGVPADPSHDKYRCQTYTGGDGCSGSPGDHAEGPNPFTAGSPKAFLTNPTSCETEKEGLRFDLFVRSWEKPSNSDSASFVTTTNPPIDNTPVGPSGCDRVPFQPRIEVQPTTGEAETPTGLEVVLTIPPDGLENPTGISQSHLKDAVVYLPEGMTVNPSQANGLAVCTPSQIGLTSGDSRPVRFSKAKPTCPDASQIGEVRLKTPLLHEELSGAVFLAQQSDPSVPGSENPFNSDLALYIAIEGQGILVKLAGEVAPDPKTGQIVTRFLNNPQQPFSRFAFKFKGGQRAPLSMPPTCGSYTTKAVLTPWARPDQPIEIGDAFQVSKGPNGGPCPAGGVPPFNPDFTAGTVNNNAGSYSPFVMRLTRKDGEQGMTKFSSILPPGVVGKLAGVTKCSDAALAAAPQKTGRQEQASPSCPFSSQIGRVEAGAGVGSIQVYVPGKIYLAGPYNGAPLSVAVITPAVAGPFDVGNVVVREALDLNPKTAEVEVDGDASDPIPHILRGIPLRLRDLRVFVDKDNFILNPTSCDPSATKATLFGSFLDVLSPSDDVPVALEDRFQAANCANLGFKPKLNLTLTGGTKRGGHPGLKAVYKPRPGDANVSGVTVRLPRSAFLDQAHIRTICTRVQFAAENCPPAAQYGYIRAFTPLLDEPLQGPVWLRSSNNKLPDLVFDLQGIVDVEVATRIDSIRGGIRANVETAPDAPLSKVVLTMQGGKKGLIVNSTNLCKGTNRGEVNLSGHNGKDYEARPVVKPAGCGKASKGKAKRR